MNDLTMEKGAGLGDSVQDSKVVGRLTHSGAAEVLFSFSKNIACKWELRSFYGEMQARKYHVRIFIFFVT